MPEATLVVAEVRGGKGTVGAQACDAGGGADQGQGSDDFAGGGVEAETHDDELPFP